MQLLKSYKTKQKVYNIFKIILFSIISVFIVAPLFVTLFASVKTGSQMTNTSPILPPSFSQMTFENMKEVLSDDRILYAVKNTVFIVVVSITINVFIGSMTAYILDRFNFKLRKYIYVLFFASTMVPSYITEITRFKVIQSLNAYNSLRAPILIYITCDLMQLYIYRQFLSKIPVSLDESAMLDGCGYFKTYRKIIFPLLAPATSTLVIIKLVWVVNDMYIPYLYMPSRKLKTMTTFLMEYANARSGSWQKLSAAVIIVMIPTFIIYLLFQRKIVDGLAMGAVKE